MNKFTCDYIVKEAEVLLKERALEPQELGGTESDVSDRAAQNTYTNATLKESRK